MLSCIRFILEVQTADRTPLSPVGSDTRRRRVSLIEWDGSHVALGGAMLACGFILPKLELVRDRAAMAQCGMQTVMVCAQKAYLTTEATAVSEDLHIHSMTSVLVPHIVRPPTRLARHPSCYFTLLPYIRFLDMHSASALALTLALGHDVADEKIRVMSELDIGPWLGTGSANRTRSALRVGGTRGGESVGDRKIAEFKGLYSTIRHID